MDAKTPRDRVDRRVGDLAQAMLNRLDDTHKPTAVGSEFLDNGVDRGSAPMAAFRSCDGLRPSGPMYRSRLSALAKSESQP